MEKLKIHPPYQHVLVLKLCRDCTEKLQEPQKTNVLRLQAITVYYHFAREVGLIYSFLFF